MLSLDAADAIINTLGCSANRIKKQDVRFF